MAAQIATETVCKCFSELNNPLEQFENKEDLAKHILDAAVMNIQEKAIEMGVPLNEMDCTLMFVCVIKTTNYAIIGRLGDSAVCIIAYPKSIAINDGNKSANGTNAILDKDAIEHFDIQIIDLDKNNIYGFILSSDGLENELYMKGSDHVNKTAELYFNAWFTSDDPITVIAERISKLTEIEGTPFDDDISVAVLSRTDEKSSYRQIRNGCVLVDLETICRLHTVSNAIRIFLYYIRISDLEIMAEKPHFLLKSMNIQKKKCVLLE